MAWQNFEENATASAHSNQDERIWQSALDPSWQASRLLDQGKRKTATGASYLEIEGGPKGVVETPTALDHTGPGRKETGKQLP